jgi:hypothetical protein
VFSHTRHSPCFFKPTPPSNATTPIPCTVNFD